MCMACSRDTASKDTGYRRDVPRGNDSRPDVCGCWLFDARHRPDRLLNVSAVPVQTVVRLYRIPMAHCRAVRRRSGGSPDLRVAR